MRAWTRRMASLWAKKKPPSPSGPAVVRSWWRRRRTSLCNSRRSATLPTANSSSSRVTGLARNSAAPVGEGQIQQDDGGRGRLELGLGLGEGGEPAGFVCPCPGKPDRLPPQTLVRADDQESGARAVEAEAILRRSGRWLRTRWQKRGKAVAMIFRPGQASFVR